MVSSGWELLWKVRAVADEERNQITPQAPEKLENVEAAFACHVKLLNKGA